MGTTTDPTKLTIIQKLEQSGHAALDATEHAAVRLVGEMATVTTGIHDIEASSPLAQAIIQDGIQSAKNYGIPVDGIVVIWDDVVAAATAFAAGLAQPPAPATGAVA